MNGIINGLAAGIAASLLCFVVNGYVLKFLGDRAMVTYIPVIEEGSKTFIAVAMGGEIIFSHMAFGIIEALYDLHNSPGEYRFTAFILSLLSHLVLGIVTFYCIKAFGRPVLAVVLSATLHGFWNRFITGYTG